MPANRVPQNIVNKHGVPLAAQRSDDWILEETPVTMATPTDMPEDAARGLVANQIRKTLERDDLDRRVKEAEASIAELKPLFSRTCRSMSPCEEPGAAP